MEQILYLQLMQGIYLSLGTNLGNREDNLRDAQKHLQSHGVSVLRASMVYQTAAWGKEDQPNFLNQVIEIDTNHSPQELLQEINGIEKEMGRIRFEKWGERLIDIDILYYRDEIVDEPGLNVPHPEIAQRRFVLEPLVELASQELHPKLNRSQAELLLDCTDALEVKCLHPIETNIDAIHI